jgi:hypothetical protein
MTAIMTSLTMAIRTNNVAFRDLGADTLFRPVCPNRIPANAIRLLAADMVEVHHPGRIPLTAIRTRDRLRFCEQRPSLIAMPLLSRALHGSPASAAEILATKVITRVFHVVVERTDVRAAITAAIADFKLRFWAWHKDNFNIFSLHSYRRRVAHAGA